MGAFGAGLLPPLGPSHAKEPRRLGNEAFSIDLPDGFTWNEKWIFLKTHEFEQAVTANEPYNKWTIGVTVDSVNANSLADVGTVEQGAARVEAALRGKDGHIQTDFISAVRAEVNGIPVETMEYRSETIRGFYHYNTRAAVYQGKLYTLTSQAPEGKWSELKELVQAVAASWKLRA